MWLMLHILIDSQTIEMAKMPLQAIDGKIDAKGCPLLDAFPKLNNLPKTDQLWRLGSTQGNRAEREEFKQRRGGCMKV